LNGVKTLLSTQAHARLHLLATLLVIGAGFFVRLRRWEWVAILLCIGMVWLALAEQGKETDAWRESIPKDRISFKQIATQSALDRLRIRLKGSAP